MPEEHTSGYKTYVTVWAILMALTVVTVWVSTIDIGVMNAVVALIIASIKASLVALFFMHLKDESKLIWAFALFPLVFLMIIIFGTLMDTQFR